MNLSNEVRISALQALRNLCEEQGYSIREVCGRRGKMHKTTLRRTIAVVLYAKGYNPSAIARAMRKDHTTIAYYLRKELGDYKKARN